jgi:hypothetical protein
MELDSLYGVRYSCHYQRYDNSHFASVDGYTS